MGVVDWFKRAFGASKTTEAYTPPRNASFSPDGDVQDASTHLRAWGRHFESNSDIAVGILDELVDQTVGAGISIEPAVVDSNGTPLEAINEALRELLEEFEEAPDVTRQITWAECQRLIARGWYRDGEYFIHHVQGRDRGYPFAPGQLPYLIELVEADRIPLDPTTDEKNRSNVFQGVEIDQWHRPRAYRVLIADPGSNSLRFSPVATAGFTTRTKRVPSEQMTHIAWRKRYP